MPDTLTKLSFLWEQSSKRFVLVLFGRGVTIQMDLGSDSRSEECTRMDHKMALSNPSLACSFFFNICNGTDFACFEVAFIFLQ